MIYLDFWIIGLLLTWRDYETKSRATLLSAPINPIKCQCNRGRDWSVATQILSKWSGPMEKVETSSQAYTNWDQNETGQKGRKVETKTRFSEQIFYNIKKNTLV